MSSPFLGKSFFKRLHILFSLSSYLWLLLSLFFIFSTQVILWKIKLFYGKYFFEVIFLTIKRTINPVVHLSKAQIVVLFHSSSTLSIVMLEKALSKAILSKYNVECYANKITCSLLILHFDVVVSILS